MRQIRKITKKYNEKREKNKKNAFFSLKHAKSFQFSKKISTSKKIRYHPLKKKLEVIGAGYMVNFKNSST